MILLSEPEVNQKHMPKSRIATGRGGDRGLAGNSGGAPLIRTGDLRIMIPSL